MIATRIDDSHDKRLRELSQVTGLNVSQILRALIENSRLEMKPFPVGHVVMQKNTSAVIDRPHAGVSQ